MYCLEYRETEKFYIHVPSPVGPIGWNIQHIPTCIYDCIRRCQHCIRLSSLVQTFSWSTQHPADRSKSGPCKRFLQDIITNCMEGSIEAAPPNVKVNADMCKAKSVQQSASCDPLQSMPLATGSNTNTVQGCQALRQSPLGQVARLRTKGSKERLHVH